MKERTLARKKKPSDKWCKKHCKCCKHQRLGFGDIVVDQLFGSWHSDKKKDDEKKKRKRSRNFFDGWI